MAKTIGANAGDLLVKAVFSPSGEISYGVDFQMDKLKETLGVTEINTPPGKFFQAGGALGAISTELYGTSRSFEGLKQGLWVFDSVTIAATGDLQFFIGGKVSAQLNLNERLFNDFSTSRLLRQTSVDTDITVGIGGQAKATLSISGDFVLYKVIPISSITGHR